VHYCQTQCNFGGIGDLCKQGKEYLTALKCKFCISFLTKFWNAFLSLVLAKLSDLKNIPFFAHLVVLSIQQPGKWTSIRCSLASSGLLVHPCGRRKITGSFTWVLLSGLCNLADSCIVSILLQKSCHDSLLLLRNVLLKALWALYLSQFSFVLVLYALWKAWFAFYEAFLIHGSTMEHGFFY